MDLIAQFRRHSCSERKDLDAFGSSKDKQAMADRLRLTPERVKAMADGIREVAALNDPVGQTLNMQRRPNGMQVGRVRVPIGVIGIIYESRPNVTADSAALCLKSGNVCVLRGGSEAIHSNTAIAAILSEAAEKAGVPAGAIIFLDRTDRDIISELLKQDQYVDLIIPRGGESLMKTVTAESRIPVIKHDKGVCHTYIDADADVTMAKQIALNAKVQRPSTCNAMETLLVHHTIARAVLPALVNDFMAAGVEVRGCSKTLSLCPAGEAGSRQRLRPRISLPDSCRQDREKHGRGDGPYRALWLTPYGSDRDEGLWPGLEIFERGGRRRRAGQRVYTAK